IPAGGIGSRLWPLSRADAPKFLHDLTGSGQTLLRDTWDRLVPLSGEQRIMVVTGRAHRAAVETQLPALTDPNIVLESEPRDSTAAIGLAAAILERREPGVIIGSFAADHVIDNLPLFQSAVREAVASAEAGFITTIGIRPTEPAVGFGYIHYGDRLLDEIGRNKPQLLEGLLELAAAWDDPATRGPAVDRIWPALEKIAIDYTVAEPAAAAGRLAVIPGYFDWDD